MNEHVDAVLSTAPDGNHAGNAATAPAGEARNPLLAALGDRVRNLRAQRGLTRKAVAISAGVSERHLANLEYGIGNASILVLQQVAGALHCSLAELVGDVTTSSPEWLLIRELLEKRSETDLRRVRLALGELLGTASVDPARHRRIALVGLRGAGKSTLGQMLADDLDVPFVELSREIEKLAGCSVREIHDLYGTNAYRRYERRALEEAVQIYSEVVIATPGGIVSDPRHLQRIARALHHRVAAGRARRAHGPRGRAGRHPPDGGQQGSHGRPAAHPERARRLLFEGRSLGGHQRQDPGAELPGAARRGPPVDRHRRLS
ncbi:XRE family aerobic/anaerobic benzoate catabolism transcriptional regulator [Variovorax paradoxus]|nr:XRE family aerobic/anaerobic benzoate catabolism transcriptional regulator [Variovorax paradoxus]